jgi:MoaA/NifB/PqqE/SkfB family radical SAM enzyme
MEGVITAWGRILRGYRPNLSIEITRECPLRCPGCYAYGDEHLGGAVTLRELADLKGQALVDGILDVVRVHKPVHVSLVGGEPLVRYRELDVLLPRLAARGIYTQVVTSAVRPIPAAWASIPRLQVCVSIDGLPAEHDRRRAPATYDRVLKHIRGQRITVHSTVTRQIASRPGYLEAFLHLWQENPDTRTIWVSLYTPQVDEVSDERLRPDDRRHVIAELRRLRPRFSKLQLPDSLLDVYAEPPASPDDCIFAKTTQCLSADLRREITPCQFGGTPSCTECGCMASGGLGAVGRHRLPGGVTVGAIFNASLAVGARVAALRGRASVEPAPDARPVAAGGRPVEDS